MANRQRREELSREEHRRMEEEEQSRKNRNRLSEQALEDADERAQGAESHRRNKRN